MGRKIEVDPEGKYVASNGRTYSAVQGVGTNFERIKVTSFSGNGRMTEPSYKAWHSMLTRCYCKKFQDIHPTYKGCKVCEEWQDYSNFLKFYDEYYIDGFHLDKDILVKGNKVYSPTTCMFVPQRINKLLLCRGTTSKTLPNGVSYRKDGRVLRYTSQIRRIGTNGRSTYEHLGSFSTPEAAFQTYKSCKEKYIKEVAEEYFKSSQICEEAYKSLMTWRVV